MKHSQVMSTGALVCLLALSFLPGCGDDTVPGFGLALDGLPVTEARIENAAAQIGWPVSLVVFFLQWPDDKISDFPALSIQAITEAGAVPVITWEPMVIRNGEEQAISAEAITSGDWDGYIDGFAGASRDSGTPIIIRFAHEMNLARYHWGGEREAYGSESPARYRAMFRHVRERFRLQGADNVLFAFCPNAESLPAPDRDGATWNTASAYYPGDDVVDVLGMDGYNWGTAFTKNRDGWNSRFMSFSQIFSPLRKELKSLAPEKPMIVFETASVAHGGDKTAWIEDAARVAGKWGLAGLCWFDVNKEQDWRFAADVNYESLRPLAESFVRDAGSLSLPGIVGGRP